MNEIHGFELTLPAWSERLRSDEYRVVSQYKVYEPGEKLSSREVLEIILDHDVLPFLDTRELLLLFCRAYGVRFV